MARVRQELLHAAAELRRRDPVLREFIDRCGPPRFGRRARRDERFAALARAVCYQQLAGRAASAIHGRFAALFDDHPTAEAVLARTEVDLRACGLSAAKSATIRDLAARVVDGTVELDRMGYLSDSRVVEELTTVRGIGVWTAQMFLMAQLSRLDVWPTGDLGVRAGYQRLYRLDDPPTARDLEPRGEAYRPYRSVVAWYCWRAVDVLSPV